MQQLQLPEFLKPLMSGLEAMEPSELLRVSLNLSPKIAAVGEGEPIIAEGVVTLLDIPVPFPVPVIVQVTKRPEELATPVAFGFTMPLTGTFRIPVATEGWDYEQYAFQALAFAVPGPPGLSTARVKGIEAPRYGVAVTMEVREAGAPGTLDIDASVGDIVYVDYTVTNTGNRTQEYETYSMLNCPETGTTYEAHAGYLSIGSIGPGLSSTQTDSIRVPAGASEGYYHGWVRVRGVTGGYAEDESPDIVHVYTYIYEASLTGVSWHL